MDIDAIDVGTWHECCKEGGPEEEMGQGLQQRHAEQGVRSSMSQEQELPALGSNQQQMESLGAVRTSETPLLDAAGLQDEPLPVVEDATPEQIAVLSKAVDRAREMLDDGIALMQRGPEGEPALFDAHFHTRDAGLLSCAMDALQASRQGLSGRVPLEVEGWSLPWPFEEHLGYVYGGPFRSASNIHIEPAFFYEGPEARASIIIHEATHKYADAKDHAYSRDKGYDKLAPELAVENADSLSGFCWAEGERVKQERDEGERRDAEAAAAACAEAIFAAYEAGHIQLSTSTYTTPEGLLLEPSVVVDAIFAYFRDHRPAHYQEVVRWLDTHDPAAVSCADGTIVGEDLVEVVFWRIS